MRTANIKYLFSCFGMVLVTGAALAACVDGPAPVDGEDGEELGTAQDAICVDGPGCNPGIGLADYPISPSLVLSRNTESIPSLNDSPILDKTFPLKDVVQQLLTLSGADPSETPDEWLARLWDTQNPSPATFNEPFQPHCSDDGQTINGYPVDCPRPEGQLSSNVTVSDFFPIAVFNRFDLAPEDGSHCGEYRILYAMENFTSGGVFGRNFIIFEGQLANPTPECGIEACRPVVDFWSSLASLPTQGDIAKALRHFYFKGINGFAPVIKPEHYGFGAKPGGGYGTSGGQIRTNQFVDFNLWQLREFQLDMECTKKFGCRLFSQPVSVKNNPFFDLYDGASGNPAAPAFQSSFPMNVGGNSQVSRLAVTHPNTVTNLNLIAMEIDNKFNAGQSTSQGSSEAYLGPFQNVPLSSFNAGIQSELFSIGSSLTPDEIVQRSEAQSCKGCHQLSNGDPTIGGGLTWPNSNGFTHVEESGVLSQALRCVFLPHRQAVGIGFLQNCGGNPKPVVPSDPDCVDFQSGGGGYDGPKKGKQVSPEVVQAAKDVGAPSPILTLGGGSKIN